MCEAPDMGSALGVRDRVAIEILYATALRRAELLALDLGDVSVEDMVVRVRRGKGGKGRVRHSAGQRPRCWTSICAGFALNSCTGD